MKRWGIAFFLCILASIPILLSRASSPELLQDSDTAVLLHHIRERNAPLSWFAGDWPLFNHFYRPISTLAFEWDNYRFGNDAAGYGLTNALLCVACVGMLFWLARELFDSPLIAGSAASLFALWHYAGTWILADLVIYLGYAALLFGAVQHRRSWGYYLPAFLVLWLLSREMMGMVNLRTRMIDWIPGRTASVMTVFALAALAAYARYERLGAGRHDSSIPSPTDPPATRNTVVGKKVARYPAAWAPLSAVMLGLALGSYEQAVMLPALLLGVALTLRFRGYRVRFGWQGLYWAMLVGYLVLRRQIVPSDPSGYQLQQFRGGPGVFISLTDYLFPAAYQCYLLVLQVREGPLMLLNLTPYITLTNIASNVVTFVQARRAWVICLFGWLCSFFAYLPMAWLKPFDHYHYLPMAMRTFLVIGLGLVAKELWVTAVSPPTRQAPIRPVPAPGSLPRP